ncbi:3-demethylubiquinone-9 3-methyltransferase, putative [Plasmodium gallinaceum]|uniref:3-demethylubiquinone-9 3-methyltransferase, putative n=1 Tax=Plasmodium gallinaceum TaxID=5849 RepID=A0A1J1GT08_PLAGA|nr:3-demethylubiquinone-9 3-methyltransferase, putative [Plasmodium gallinaceum]CRG94432.1 3-demethylubiquinone-9 3-methyltransferase, putative [Plasmodium gallinaceum]
MKKILNEYKNNIVKFLQVNKKFFSEKTYDENEKLFFNNLNKIWWDKTENENFCDILEKIIGKNLYSLHDYNKCRFDFIFNNYEFIYFENFKKQKQFNKKINILDVGCGAGILCEYIKNNIYYFLIKNNIISYSNNSPLEKVEINIDGIDISNNLIDLAKKRQANEKEHFINYNNNDNTVKEYLKIENKIEYNKIKKENRNININLNYINCDIVDLVNSNKLNQKKYDIIISSEVIEHISNNKKISFIKYISQLSKPNALVVFTSINKNFLSYFYTIILAEYLTGIIKKGTHNYEKFIDIKELNMICEYFNLNNINTKYVIYFPFIRNYFTTKKLKLLYLSAFVYKQKKVT